MSNNYFDWVDEHTKDKGAFYCPAMDAQQAINMLTDYLLGDAWYIVDPVTTAQTNTIVVHDILERYSKQYKKEKKQWLKEHKKDRL